MAVVCGSIVVVCIHHEEAVRWSTCKNKATNGFKLKILKYVFIFYVELEWLNHKGRRAACCFCQITLRDIKQIGCTHS